MIYTVEEVIRFLSKCDFACAGFPTRAAHYAHYPKLPSFGQPHAFAFHQGAATGQQFFCPAAVSCFSDKPFAVA